MRRNTALLLSLSLSLSSALAATNVAFDPETDFSRYRTYAWGEGTPAATPQVQRWVEMAVERELESKGLRKAPLGQADLQVVSVAYAQMEEAMRGNYVHLDVWNVGIITADVVNKTTGNLMLDLIDSSTEKPVWRGVLEKAMNEQSLAKVQKKIDKLIKKLLRDFPPPS